MESFIKKEVHILGNIKVDQSKKIIDHLKDKDSIKGTITIDLSDFQNEHKKDKFYQTTLF